MRRLLTILLLILGAALPAGAATIEERIAAELQAQGYEILEANRTWLGRWRIVAEKDEIRREIVFNPGTGEILRDYSVLLTVLEQRQRDLARSSKAPRAARVPAHPATGEGGVPVADGVVEGPVDEPADTEPDPVDEPAEEEPDPDEPAAEDPDPEEPAVVAGPLPDDDRGSAIPLLPEPLIPAEDE